MAKLYLLSLFLFCSVVALGQTKGLIYKPASTDAGKAVLDPNKDGYTSSTSAGFTSNDRDESEINYIPLPVLHTEPVQDLLKGPACGFTDVVDSGNGDPVMFFFDPVKENFLVRFRLNKTSPNTKAYSILIDADEKFGFSGPEADPDALAGNPGFEFELVMITNGGINLYDVNGTLSPVLKTSMDYNSHSQKSVAYSENCGDADYFYDFYIPWSAFGLPLTTKLRMAALTVMSPSPAIGSNTKSDVGGGDDRLYGGDYDRMFLDLILGYNPTAPGDAGTTPLTLSRCPSITSAVYANSTSVTGTSLEADGTQIDLYKNGNLLLGSTTVSGGNWTVSGISGLVAGDAVTAIATATGKAASRNCNSTQVQPTYTPPCTNPYQPVNVAPVNAGKGLSGNILAPTPTNIKVLVYHNGNLIHTSGILTVSGSSPSSTTNQFCFRKSNTGVYTLEITDNCTNGAPVALEAGLYRFVVITANQYGNYVCNSAPTYLCVGTTVASTTPVITTGTIYENSTSVSGTAAAGSFLIFKVNGVERWTQKLAAGVTSWSQTVSDLKLGDTFSVAAAEDGKCLSSEASKTVSGPLTSAPAVTGSYCASASGSLKLITGTCNEQDGTVIELFRGSVSLGTTTVANGNWSMVATVFASDVLTAKATAPGKILSDVSNSITINNSLSSSTVSINGPLQEGATTVSGTSTAAGTIKLYIDGFLVGQTTTAGSAWSISGIPSTEIYAGGFVSATVTPATGCESEPSASITVDCITPVTGLSIASASSVVCAGQTTSFVLNSSENLVIYELYIGGTKTGSSVLGTGGDITLTSGPVSASAELSIKAFKISNVPCTATLVATHQVTVNPLISNNTVAEPLSGTSFCGTATVSELVGSVPEGGNGSYTFQWQRSTDNTTWTDIEDATASNYTPGTVTATTYFRRKVISGPCQDANESASVMITIHPALVNDITYSGTQAFCSSGQPGEITGNAVTGANSYQWQISQDNNVWADIENATLANYTPESINATTYFRRKVITSNCEVISSPLTFTVYPVLANNSITAPASALFCNGGNVAEITGSTPEGGDGTYTYRWQISTDNGASYADISPAVTTPNYTPGNVTQTTFFRRIVETGTCSSLESNAVKVTVVSAEKSTLTADASSIPADGVSSTTIRVQLKDTFETDITSEACALNLATSSGTISGISYEGNGVYTAILTSSTTSGVATISGTLDGAAMTQTAEVTFTPTLKVSVSKVSASPVSVPADGSSTSLARVAFEDYAGNAITVEDAKVELILDGVVVSVIARGNGVYEAVVPARVNAGIVQVTARYDGVAIADNASVEFFSQVNQTATTITANPTQVNADGTSTSTIQVAFRDHAGNGIAMDASKLTIYAGGTAMANVQDRGNGVFEAVLPGRIVAETVNVTASYDGAALPGSAVVNFVPVVNLTTATTLTVAPAQVNADGTSTSTATLSFFDYAGNAIDMDAAKVAILLDGVQATVTETGKGVFTATVPASTVAKTVTVTAKYDGSAVAGSPTVTFVPVVNMTVAAVTATPETVNADGMSTAVATVSFSDYNGDAIAMDASKVQIFIEDMAVAVQAAGTGVYTATVPASTIAKTVNITAAYDGAALADNASVTFVPVVNTSATTLTAAPAQVNADGTSTATVTLSFFDYAGDAITVDATKVAILLDGIAVSATDNGNGVFVATVPARTAAALVNVTASYDGAVLAPTAQVEFVPVAQLTATAVTATPGTLDADGVSTATATVSFLDYAGNPKAVDAADVVILLNGTAVTVTAAGEGVFTAEVPARTIAETVTVTSSYKGSLLSDNATVTFVPAVKISATTVEASPAQVPADGSSTATATVSFFDYAGNPIAMDIAQVELLLNDVSATVVASGTGTYTTTVPASTVASTVTVTAKYTASSIADNATVNFVPVANLVATTLTASPSQVNADGVGTATATLSFIDHAGNPVAVDAGKVEIFLDGLAATVTETGSGVFEATVPASTIAKTVTVTAKYDGSAVAGSPTVTFVPVVNMTVATVTATPETVNADGMSTAVAKVSFSDYNGDAVDADISKVKMYFDGVAATIQANGTGVYTAIVPASTQAKTVSVTADYDGTALSDDASVTFVPVVNLAATTLTAAPTQVNADGTSTATATLSFFDYAGNPITVDHAVVAILLDGVAVSATDNGNGVFTATVPARTNAATVTVTAKLADSAISANATVEFVPVVNLATATTLTVAPAQVNADGVGTSTATLSFFDYAGNAIDMDVAKVAILLDGVQATVTETGKGVFTATVPASTVAKTVTVTAQYESNSVAGSATVTFVPVAQLTATAVTATPGTVDADGVSTATATVSFLDYAGNPKAVDAADVEILLNGTGVTLTAVSEGMFTAEVPARTVAETVTVTASYKGSLLNDNATVTFVPAVKISATVVEASPAQVPANGTSTSTATVSFFDYAGNPIAVNTSEVEILLDGVAVAVTAAGTGAYTATVPARTNAATVTVTAKLADSAISANATVEFVPVVNLATATTLTVAPAQVNADGVGTSTATLSFFDYAGNAISMDVAKVAILLDGVQATVTETGNGVFTATVPASTTAKTVTVTAQYDGAAVAGNPTVTFVPALNLAATTISATPAKLDADRSSTSLVQLSFFDFAGNPITVDAADVEILLDNITSTVTPGGKGVFNVTVPAKSAAAIVIATARFKGTALNGQAQIEFVMPAPAVVQTTVVANPTTVVADGVSASTITVQLKDANGYNTISNEQVTITSSLGTVSTVTYNGNGNYTALLTSTVTGSATVTAKLGTETLAMQPVVTFLSGGASGISSTITSSVASIPANGAGTAIITVTLYDGNGNRITNGGATVTLATTLGTLQAITDNQNGTYTAVLTSGWVSGTAVVSGTVNGIALGSTANVVFTFVNRGPVAQDDAYQVNNHEKLTANVLVNDTDPDGDQLSAKTALVRQPIFGTVIMNSDGSFVYTPKKGFVGEDSFKYQVCDNRNPALCAEATVTIQVVQGQVFIPEGFSPDGDGENDLFTIYGAEKYRVALKVFNRWGTIVYENNDYKNDWSGEAKSGIVLGNKLPDGTYFYIVDLNNGEKPRSHSLIIKRK